MSTFTVRPFMSEQRATAYAEAWIDAWNAQDLDRIMSHYAAELEFTSPLVRERRPGSDGVIRDAVALRAYFATGLAMSPSLHFELIETLIGVYSFVIYYVNARGGRTAETFELDDRDQAVKVACCYSPFAHVSAGLR